MEPLVPAADVTRSPEQGHIHLPSVTPVDFLVVGMAAGSIPHLLFQVEVGLEAVHTMAHSDWCFSRPSYRDHLLTLN